MELSFMLKSWAESPDPMNAAIYAWPLPEGTSTTVHKWHNSYSKWAACHSWSVAVQTTSKLPCMLQLHSWSLMLQSGMSPALHFPTEYTQGCLIFVKYLLNTLILNLWHVAASKQANNLTQAHHSLAILGLAQACSNKRYYMKCTYATTKHKLDIYWSRNHRI